MSLYNKKTISIVAPIFVSIISLIYLKFYGVFPFYSDVVWYWNYVENLDKPFFEWHLTGYPYLIYCFKTLTFNIFKPYVLMTSIGITIFCISSFVVFEILKNIFDDNSALIGSLIFCFWPVVGSFYGIIWPNADGFLILLLLSGLLSYLRGYDLVSFLFLSIALITHKASWFFAIPMTYYYFVSNCKRIKILKILTYYFVMILPLFLLWYKGVAFGASFTWLFDNSMKGLSHYKEYPLFDSVIQNIIIVLNPTSGLIQYCKSLLTIFPFVLSFYLLLFFIRAKKTDHKTISLIIIWFILIMYMSVNNVLGNACLRYSKILTIPLSAMIITKYPEIFTLVIKNVKKASLIGFLSILSHIIFIYYVMTNHYH